MECVGRQRTSEKMIISASRRTDIPSYYSDWLINRIREKYVLVRNPMNMHKISRINLSPDVVDGIVFWTKNPAPMIEKLDELKDYMYYFQFTVTPYEKDIEMNLPSKNSEILNPFKRLSDKIGADRVIWRYDPILINHKYSSDYHMHAFGKMADALHDYTRKVTISFMDDHYRNAKRNLIQLDLTDFSAEMQIKLSSSLSKTAHSYGLEIDTCSEKIDLANLGIGHARCIDGALFEKLLGYRLDIRKDKSQRPECGCAAAIDIGMYNTCKNGCLYCYANYNQSLVSMNCINHNTLSPLLSGEVESDDTISDRVCTTHALRDDQV